MRQKELVQQNRRVYIAGPISNGHTATPRATHKNVRNAERYYEHLIQMGFTPICPHLSYHAWLNFQDEVHWPRWIEMDLDVLDVAAALIRIPGDSIGADMEVKYAEEHNIPIVYANAPSDAYIGLVRLFGEPKPRQELDKYLKMINPKY